MRNLHSASTVVIGEQSNTNINNNNGRSNSTPNVSDDDKIANSSRIEIGHMVSTAASETDSVFIRNPNEAVDTHTQESIIETPAASAHDVQLLGEGANQQPHETAEPQQKEAGDEVTSVGQPPADGATAQEENAARPPSSLSRKEIDECNSLSQLPKVIVRKSINRAIKRLSLHKDDEAETVSGGAKEEQPEAAVPQEDKVNQLSQQEEAEGECTKKSQPEVPSEGQPMVAEEVKDTNHGAESQKVQEDVITEPQVETAEATTSRSEEGTTEEVHVSGSTTNTDGDSTSRQESPVVGATSGGAAMKENRPEGETVTDQKAAASDDNVPENNKDDQAGGVGTAEPIQAEEKGDSGKGDDGSSETPKEIVPPGSSDESAMPPDVQETQQQENDTPQ